MTSGKRRLQLSEAETKKTHSDSTKKISKCKSSTKLKRKDETPCSICGVKYGDASDKKITEEWHRCRRCSKWFHESCAQANGILDIG